MRAKAFLVKALLGALAGLLLAPHLHLTAPEAGARNRRGRPNILLIVTDDQRWDEGTMKVMPGTRAIGREGVTFPKAYITNPLCCPSRATIMTGQYSHNHGVLDNEKAHLLDQDTTLQARLDKAGYRTAVFGKFLKKIEEEDPEHFDRWFVHRYNVDYNKTTFNDQGAIKKFKGYSTDILKRKVRDHLQELERGDRKPWFTLIAPIAPHLPARPDDIYKRTDVPKWGPSRAVKEGYEDEDVEDKPPWVQSKPPPDLRYLRRLRARQLRTLISVDEMIARVDQTLRALNEKKDTLVIFISDNGFSYGEHRMYGRGRWKNHPYTSSIKTPFILRYPGKDGSIDRNRLITNVDIAPTLYDAANVAPPTEVDGHSLLDPTWQRRFVFLEHFLNPDAPAIPTWYSLRYNDHQYVEYYEEEPADVEVPIYREYYDLENDAWQLDNLLGDSDPLNDPNTAEDSLLIKRLEDCHGTSGDNPCP